MHRAARVDLVTTATSKAQSKASADGIDESTDEIYSRDTLKQSSYVDDEALKAKRVLYCAGFSPEVTQLIALSVFQTFGEVSRLILPADRNTGAHKGFGFVIFEEKADANEARANVDGSELFGRTLRVSLAKPNALHKEMNKELQDADKLRNARGRQHHNSVDEESSEDEDEAVKQSI